jgi:geranylgeranyl reductase family protein
VVGGGPAGAWAAYRLARAGARVTIFDASHPREKPCGGGVTGRAMAIVAGALEHRPLEAVSIASAAFLTSGRTIVSIPLGPGGQEDGSSLVVTSRGSFDAALLAAAVDAGAGLRTERVRDVTVSAAGAAITAGGRTFRCDHVIGADGANSLVRRRVRTPFTREQLSIAAGYFARGATSREIAIELEADPAGYLWSFPRPDHLAIGVCAQADTTTSRALWERTATWIGRSALGAGAQLVPYSWPIPSLSADDLNREQPSGPGWLLVGDAAGLVDPITREGIFFALQSGGFAADALIGPPGQGPAIYRERLEDEIYSELRRAARFKLGFFRPAFLQLLFEALEHSAPVRRVLVDLVAGVQPYRTLKRRLLATLDVRLAWKVWRRT